MQSEALLTPSEVAEILKVSTATVHTWAASGRIKCVTTPSGRRRFRREDIETAKGEQ